MRVVPDEDPVRGRVVTENRWNDRPAYDRPNGRLQRLRRSMPDWPESLARYVTDNPPTEAEWAWVEDNYRLLVKLVHDLNTKNYRYYDSIDDAVGFVLPNVVKALRMYDPAKGFALSTYVATAIRNGLTPRRVWGRTTVFGYARNGKTTGQHHSPRPPVALEQRDVVRAVDELRPEPDATPLYEALTKALDRLKPRRREVLDRYLGLTRDRQTLKQVGEDVGLTRERVRQIVLQAMRDVADFALGGQQPLNPTTGKRLKKRDERFGGTGAKAKEVAP